MFFLHIRETPTCNLKLCVSVRKHSPDVSSLVFFCSSISVSIKYVDVVFSLPRPAVRKI